MLRKNLFHFVLVGITAFLPSFSAMAEGGKKAPQCKLSFTTQESWNVTQKGLSTFKGSLYRMEEYMHYLITGMLSKNHLLVDGPGGGGKTYSVNLLLKAQMKTLLSSWQSMSREEINEWKKSIDEFGAYLPEAISSLNVETKENAPRLRTYRLITALSVIKENMDRLSIDDIKSVTEKMNELGSKLPVELATAHALEVKKQGFEQDLDTLNHYLHELIEMIGSSKAKEIKGLEAWSEAIASLDSLIPRSIRRFHDDAILEDGSVFTLQMQRMMNEQGILGAINPFEFIGNKNEYAVDYSRALIAKKNLFAILDEIEKAPVSVQMTLLSILNERFATVENKIVEVMLESVVATTNASAAELISQAQKYELGGRQAFLDRLAIKFHMPNATKSRMDDYNFNLAASKDHSHLKDVLINVRGIREVVKSVEITAEMMEAIRDIAIEMDQQYTLKYNESIDKAGKNAPDYYPTFSGSTRSMSKILPMFKAAFVAQQLLQGTSFEGIRYQAELRDLINLRTALLHGTTAGFETAINKKWVDIDVLATDNFVETITANVARDRIKAKYNPVTNELVFDNPRFDGERTVYFYDAATRTLHRQDSLIGPRLMSGEKELENQIESTKRTDSILEMFENKEETRETIKKNELLRQELSSFETVQKQIEKAEKDFDREGFDIQYQVSRHFQDLLGLKAMNMGAKQQLKDIAGSVEHFLSALNRQIKAKSTGSKISMEEKSEEYKKADEYYAQQARDLKIKLEDALTSGDKEGALIASLESVRAYYKEFNYRFMNSKSTSWALFSGMLSGLNIQLFGPPGSAKTMMSMHVIESVLKTINNKEKMKVAEEVFETLQSARKRVLETELENLKQKDFGAETSALVSKKEAELKELDMKFEAYIKQFNPMTTEMDVLGHTDIGALKNSQGARIKRNKALTADKVIMVLLDEFEKASPALQTSLLSVLNERVVMEGARTIPLNIMSMVLATNTTPVEFLDSLGQMSTAYPIYQRIHTKAYVSNKLNKDDLLEFMYRTHLGFSMEMKNELPLFAVRELIKSVPELNLESKLRIPQEIEFDILSEISFRFKEEAYQEHNSSLLTDVKQVFVPTRGEDNRTNLSIRSKELRPAIVLRRILQGDSIESLVRAKDLEFKMTDVLAFVELYLPKNEYVHFVTEENPQGQRVFRLKEAEVLGKRLNTREKEMIEAFKTEYGKMLTIVDETIQKFMNEQKKVILDNPNIFPDLFVDTKTRVQWLKKQGFVKDDIVKAYGKEALEYL